MKLSSYLQPDQFRGQATVKGKSLGAYNMNYGYRLKDGGELKGEVFEVSDGEMKSLDQWVYATGTYAYRTRLEVVLEDGATKAVAYDVDPKYLAKRGEK